MMGPKGEGKLGPSRKQSLKGGKKKKVKRLYFMKGGRKERGPRNRVEGKKNGLSHSRRKKGG